jgi:hypothetical protein
VLTQVPDHVLLADRAAHVSPAEGPAPPVFSGGSGAGQLQVQPWQLWQEAVRTGRRRSSAGPGPAAWRWCDRDGTGRRACGWTTLIPSAVRTSRRPAARPADTAASPAQPGRLTCIGLVLQLVLFVVVWRVRRVPGGVRQPAPFP